MKILFVDDEIDIREVFQLLIQRAGHSIHLSRSGNEAVEMLKNGLIVDLIISDITMPDGDGYKLLEFLTVHRHQPLFVFHSGTMLTQTIPSYEFYVGSISKLKSGQLFDLIQELSETSFKHPTSESLKGV